MREIDVESAYAHWAPGYDRTPNPMVALSEQWLTGWLAKRAVPWRVVELGCGTGRNLAALKERGALRLCGVDLSQEMLDQAQVRGARLVRGDITGRTPWLDGCADLVLVNLVLEHVADPAPVFTEAARLLSPGGQLVVMELHPSAWDAGSRARIDGPDGPLYTAAHRHDAEELRRAAAGLPLVGAELSDVYPDDALRTRFPSEKRADLPWLLCGVWTRAATGRTRVIEPEGWPRLPVLERFFDYDDPMFDVMVDVPIADAWRVCKRDGLPFGTTVVHTLLRALHAVPELRTRVEGNPDRYGVVLHEALRTGSTLLDPDEQVRFCYTPWAWEREAFFERWRTAAEECLARDVRLPPDIGTDIVYLTNLPWFSFRALKHARRFSRTDTIPRLAIGRRFTTEGQDRLPVSLQVHHGLADGLHLGQFFQYAERAFTELT